MDDPLTLGGGRFTLTVAEGTPPRVTKRGDPAALAHEAAALRALAGLDGIATLADAGPGFLTMALLPGAPRDLAGVASEDLRALGALLARIHARASSEEAGLPRWDAPERDAGAYARRRAAETRAAAMRAGFTPQVPVPRAAAPFRMLHGDLVAANVLWTPGPALVDWEFWHHGDPAEDLAYLAVVNDLPATVVAAVARGYGDPAAWERARSWHALVAAEAAAWWLAAGRDDMARPLLARLGLSRPSGPSGRSRPGASDSPGAGPRPADAQRG